MLNINQWIHICRKDDGTHKSSLGFYPLYVYGALFYTESLGIITEDMETERDSINHRKMPIFYSLPCSKPGCP